MEKNLETGILRCIPIRGISLLRLLFSLKNKINERNDGILYSFVSIEYRWSFLVYDPSGFIMGRGRENRCILCVLRFLRRSGRFFRGIPAGS